MAARVIDDCAVYGPPLPLGKLASVLIWPLLWAVVMYGKDRTLPEENAWFIAGSRNGGFALGPQYFPSKLATVCAISAPLVVMPPRFSLTACTIAMYSLPVSACLRPDRTSYNNSTDCSTVSAFSSRRAPFNLA